MRKGIFYFLIGVACVCVIPAACIYSLAVLVKGEDKEPANPPFWW